MLTYTIGELVDKISIVNLKIWHLEEQMADPNRTLEEKGFISEDIVKLNNLRTKCIEAIDEFFKEWTNEKN